MKKVRQYFDCLISHVTIQTW